MLMFRVLEKQTALLNLRNRIVILNGCNFLS